MHTQPKLVNLIGLVEGGCHPTHYIFL